MKKGILLPMDLFAVVSDRLQNSGEPHRRKESAPLRSPGGNRFSQTLGRTLEWEGTAAPPDELANLLTHGLGFLLSIGGALALMQLAMSRGDQAALVASAIYSATLVGLYGASTLSHAFFSLHWRGFFQTLDQACIFLLISGSFTPFAIFYLQESWWPLLLVASWVLALVGAAAVLWMRYLSRKMQIVYLLLGWLPVISLKVIVDATSSAVVAWLVAGGLFYSVGTLFLRVDKQYRYFHAIWHAFVIAGSASHYVAVWLVVAGVPGAA